MGASHGYLHAIECFTCTVAAGTGHVDGALCTSLNWAKATARG